MGIAQRASSGCLVDWSFLEGTLLRLGFPEAWIRGVLALYRITSSRVIIGGRILAWSDQCDKDALLPPTYGPLS